jgi:hypothetical protein
MRFVSIISSSVRLTAPAFAIEAIPGQEARSGSRVARLLATREARPIRRGSQDTEGKAWRARCTVNIPQSAVLPGKQHTPNASKAMPSTRATGITIPVNSSPKSSRPTSDGTISSPIPVATSSTAATVSIFFIELLFLIRATGSGIGENSLRLYGFFLRFEFEG